MIDKQILSDDFGGFDTDNTETFALEQLTSYPGNAEGFVVMPPKAQEPVMEKIEIPAMEMTAIPEMEHSNMPLMAHSEGQDSIEEIVIDDDFIRSLQQELSNKKSQISEEAQPIVESQDFVEIDSDPHTEVIDLADIKAEHPSTFIWDEPEPQKQSDESLPDSEGFGGYGGYASMAQAMSSEEPIGNEAPPLVTENQEKKKRFVLPSFNKKALLIAASLAGVSVLGVAAYILTPYVGSMFSEKPVDSTSHNALAHDSHIAEKKEHKTEHTDANKHIDDKAITAIPDSLLNEISGDAHHNAEKQTNHAQPHTQNHKDIESTHSPESHQTVHSNQHVKKVIESKAPEHTAPKRAIAEQKVKKLPMEKRTNNVNKESPNHNRQDHSEIKNTKERIKEFDKQPEKKEVQITSTSKEMKQVYTVQVYATPSKSEAERWLQKLRTTSVNSAVITTQLIRDKTWYRVRFGNFATRDEAEKAIRSIGYDQCWIDRVR